MVASNQWFEVIKYKDYLYIIREKLDDIDPRFHSTYTNLYLLIGTNSALLIDTGAGLFPLKPIVDDIIDNRILKIINVLKLNIKFIWKFPFKEADNRIIFLILNVIYIICL